MEACLGKIKTSSHKQLLLYHLFLIMSYEKDCLLCNLKIKKTKPQSPQEYQT